MDFDQRIKLLEDSLYKLKQEYIQHKHTGKDSQKVSIYDIIKTTGTLTAIDTTPTTTMDSAVIDNTRTRLQELEDILKTNKILK